MLCDYRMPKHAIFSRIYYNANARTLYAIRIIYVYFDNLLLAKVCRQTRDTHFLCDGLSKFQSDAKPIDYK